MIKEDKSVAHVLTINGETVETGTSGYHLKSITDKLSEWKTKYAAKCKEQTDKYFGPKSEYGKLAAEIKEIAAKKPEDQTDEDRKKTVEFVEARNAAFTSYNNDPETPHVKSDWTDPNDKVKTLFDGDLSMLSDSVAMAIMGKRRIVDEIGGLLFDIMRKSSLKLAAVILEFDPDELAPGEKNNSALVVGSAFREITPVDVNVLEGAMAEVQDSMIADIRKKLNIPEDRQLIIPGIDNQ